MKRLVLVFLLFSGTLIAQIKNNQISQTLSVTQLGRKYCDPANQDQAGFSINPGTGGTGIVYKIQVTAGPKPTGSIVATANGICYPTPQSGDIIVAEETAFAPLNPTQANHSGSLFKPQVLLRKFIPDAACTGDGLTQDSVMCVFVTPTGQVTPTVSGVLFKIDTVTPIVQTINNQQPGDGQIKFTVATNKSSVTKYTLCYGTGTIDQIQAGDCDAPFQKTTSSSQDVVIKDLQNDTPYVIKVKAEDAFGNMSDWSLGFTMTPKLLISALRIYDGTPNDLSFSCAQNHATPSQNICFFALGMMLMCLRRLKSSRGHFILFALLVGIAPPAFADLGQVNFAILGTPYLPNLDGEIRNGQPVQPIYKCFFRSAETDTSGPWLPLMGFEIDVHLDDTYGSVQLGVGAGYTLASGYSLNSYTNANVCGPRVESADMNLHMYQIRPQFTYVFDPYIDIVPLVPYVRVGLVGQGYVFTFQGDIDRSGQGKDITQNPIGFRLGFTAAVGLMLALDFIEPNTSGRARAVGTYDHSYIKAELAYEPINNFFQPGFDFSSQGFFGAPPGLTATFGIGVEFL